MCDKIYEIKKKKRRRKKTITSYFEYLLLIIGLVFFIRFSYSVLSKDTEEYHAKKWSEEVIGKGTEEYNTKETEEIINSDTVEQAVSLKDTEQIPVDVKQSVSNADESTKQKQSVSNADESTKQKQSVNDADESKQQNQAVSNTDTLSEAQMIQFINEHKELYTERLVEIANSRPELVDFAYNYVNKENFKNDPGTYEINCDEVPLLLQWDKKWGYKKYGDGIIGYTGCGPTCLSMVVIYLTKDTSLTPDVIAEFSEQKGYSIPGHGTSWTLMSEGSKSYGLSVKEICLDENMIVQELLKGNPIICAMDVGDFTDQGHYIVLTGYKDGAFTVNDPNSVENSNKTWTYDRISSQIRNIWSFSILSSF